ncbi:DUF16 domain-containing protein [Mycoplasmoides pneumoniae]|uniref:DUF16 family-like protein n=4 Tax=Mycoplasmoides pneumoniae TaxID=2104 RepID=A0AAX0S214_MYCPM|nr:DUF16 domain-containing protein [Mycoplasmoides pneumoniae]ADK87192.1 conserved hypothetical protein [Mycoplasmoides pneumoniae FH]ALA30684.1 hypothetical protein B434_00635 [Mycoplasmoides pneumoniae 19294]ALA31789.1 hypothetical protein F536_02965 [Mycoplasmoides pneumoniae 39443]ALA36018.1 hypothetical protein F539_02970 [Mycoplasmoides pneumoniae FH]ALA36728.1 hypothetical protein F538_02985 [Mycoplasmoides pneumoniae M1139]
MKEKISEKEYKALIRKIGKEHFDGEKEEYGDGTVGVWTYELRKYKLKPPVKVKYVTQEQFQEYKDSNNQRLIKIETTLAAQGEQIRIQGEQIKELQIEQKAQGETLKLILQTLQKMSDRLDNMEVKMDKMEGKIDKIENRMDKMEVKMDKMEKRIDKLESK